MSGDNVVYLGARSKMNLPAEQVLHFAGQETWDGVVVVGYDEEGNERIFTSYYDGAEILWLLRRAEHHLMRNIDVATEGDD